MLLTLLLSLAIQTDGPPPITIKLNHDHFSRGDHARVYVQTARDGYLIVLHADAQARVRILFPLDPTDDAFVRGGKRVELRDRSDRDAFMVDASDGSGTVLAVVSNDPFTFDGFVLNGHWDYRALGAGSVKDDPLAGLLDIARHMSGAANYDYDVATYVVENQIAYRSGHGYRIGFADPFCYDPLWSWSVGCYGYGYGWGYGGFGYSFYRPYRYGFGRPFFGGGGAHFVIPRDRGRFTPVQARPRSGSFGRGRAVTRPTARPSMGGRRH